MDSGYTNIKSVACCYTFACLHQHESAKGMDTAYGYGFSASYTLSYLLSVSSTLFSVSYTLSYLRSPLRSPMCYTSPISYVLCSRVSFSHMCCTSRISYLLYLSYLLCPIPLVSPVVRGKYLVPVCQPTPVCWQVCGIACLTRHTRYVV